MKALGNWRNELAGLPKDYAYYDIVDEHITVPKVVHYPVGGGYLQPHVDPPAKQKLVVIAILSQRGQDYCEGGVYIENDDGTGRLLIDEQMEAGDVYIINPVTRHGVAPIDPQAALDFSSKRGRWMMFSSLIYHGSLFGLPTEGLKAFAE